jgi:four helix bundle protein
LRYRRFCVIQHANREEDVAGHTKPDFITKQFTALKESREARFWLRLIAASESGFKAGALPLIQESSELIAILTASLKTARSNPHRGEPRDPD